MKKKFFQCIIWFFVIKLNIYLLWSKIHQKLFQRKRTALPDLELYEVMQIVEASKWTPDTWRELWDVIAHPEHAYWKYQQKQTLGDCDDHAIFAAYYMKKKFGDAKLLSIQWLDKKGKFRGHNVCMFYGNCISAGRSYSYGFGEDRELQMISNSFYIPRAFHSYEDAAEYFVRDGELISWFIIESDLSKISEYHFG